MRLRSYNKEIQKATAQILDVFNDIRIDRRNNTDTVQQIISVPCIYGSRSDILKSLENRNKTLKLPLIALSMGSITKDSNRVHSTHNGLLYQNDGGGSYNYFKNTPVPINITYNIEVLTKFQEDMDQILGNFIPFFNPDVYVVIPHPVERGQKLKLQIVWDGNVALELPEEKTKEVPWRISAKTAFTFKTWMFAGMGYDDTVGNYIKRINFNPCINWDSDGVGRLSNWYDVPTYTDFDDFKENIICGFIKKPNYDEMQISGGVGQRLISGYWQDISASCSGVLIERGEILSANPCFLCCSAGFVIFNNSLVMTEGMSAMTIEDYIRYHYEMLSGDLRDYGLC